VEASVVHHPGGIGHLPVTAPLLRLRSDEQLLAQFRAGNDEAFRVLHDRYRQRLFAYVRQMLSAGSRQDAEDVMQDVFVRAYGGLRVDGREINVRAWLYRVAHNRCIDHLRRPTPPPVELYELSRKPLHDPVEEAQRREDLSRLVQDIGRLPEQQRSALLMRELDGMSYADLAAALDVTVPAVKSLLVRARVGLVDAAEARDAACAEIRDDLMRSYDRGVKASSRARRHLRSCSGCTEYRSRLRGVRHSFAALSPVGFGGPVALVAKLLGAGGAGGGAAAGGTAAAGGGAAGGAAMAATGATVTACKLAAVVCTAAITAGGAVEANHLVAKHPNPKPAAADPQPAQPATIPAAVTVPASPPAPAVHRPAKLRAPAPPANPSPPVQPVDQAKPDPAAAPDAPASTPPTADPAPPGSPDTTAPPSGGTAPPVETVAPSDPATTGGSTTNGTTPAADPPPGGDSTSTTGGGSSAAPDPAPNTSGPGATTPAAPDAQSPSHQSPGP
jgi:RNA polymerase sigma factor (sigma-70 family)